MFVVFAQVSGPSIALEWNSDETVKVILQRVINYFRLVNYNNVYLIYNDHKLDDNETLNKIGYIKGTTIYVHIENQKQSTDEQIQQTQSILSKTTSISHVKYLLEQRYIDISFTLISGPRTIVRCDPKQNLQNCIPKIINDFHLENIRMLRFFYKGKELQQTEKIEDLNYMKGHEIIVRLIK